MRAHCFLNQNIFVHTHSLWFMRTQPFEVNPTHSFINEAPGDYRPGLWQINCPQEWGYPSLRWLMISWPTSTDPFGVNCFLCLKKNPSWHLHLLVIHSRESLVYEPSNQSPQLRLVLFSTSAFEGCFQKWCYRYSHMKKLGHPMEACVFFFWHNWTYG